MEPFAPTAECGAAPSRHVRAEPLGAEVHPEEHGEMVQDHEDYARAAQEVDLPDAGAGTGRDEGHAHVRGVDGGRLRHRLFFFHSVFTNASLSPRSS